MHYYIDGYNVIFRASTPFPEPALLDQRDELIALLRTASLSFPAALTLVFDGKDHFSRSWIDNLEVVYTEKPQTADDYIIEAIASCDNPKLATVVTADKRLQHHIHALEAHSMFPKKFGDLLSKKRPLPQSEAPTDIDPYEFDRWLKIFEKRYKEL